MIHDVYIAGVAVERQRVKSVSTSEVSFNFAGTKLISSTTTVTLSNHDYMYDDRAGTGGLFESDDWYNATVTIYDVETEELVWEGRLKKITVNDGSLTTELTIQDYIRDMVDTVCVISMTGTTISEIIYAILTDANYLAIPESKLIQSGFELAKGAQQTSLVDISLTATDNKKCIAVLEELCTNSNGHIYQKDFMIGYWVWTQYTGTVANAITRILPGSYSHNTDDTNIKNSYSIAYKSGSAVAYATGSDSTSQGVYGSGKQFAMPADAVDSSLAADFKILYNTQAGAAAIGASILARYKNKKRICSFTTGWEYNYLTLGEICDLRFSPFVREPVRVIAFKPDREKRQISFTCEAVNYPEVVDLNLTQPDPVTMFSAIIFEGYIYLKWSQSLSDYLLLYRLYYSNSAGYWGGIYLSLPSNNVTILEGDCYYKFGPVTADKNYYFYVTVVDTSFNESERSNVLQSGYILDVENRYCLSGDPANGFTLDITNAAGGEGLAEWAVFDTALFDSAVFAPSAVYESPLLHNPSGFDHVTYYATGHANDVQLQYRVYDYDTSSFGNWSAAVDAVGAGSLVLNAEEYFQYRVIFNSRNWSDADKFMIREVV